MIALKAKPRRSPRQTKPASLERSRSHRRWTYDETIAELPESNLPTELWDGELIMAPAPFFFHQDIVFRFSKRLDAWVERHHLGKVGLAPVDMVLTQRDVTQPDIFFVSTGRLDILTDRLHGPADLVAEVISLGSRRRDRLEKRDLYEQHGVKEYWIIDPEAKTIEVLFLEKQTYQLAGRWRPAQSAKSRLLPGFSIPVTALFRPR